MLFREIIGFYSEKNTKPINTLCEELLNDEVGGTCNYNSALKD
jgi:hypothetical protein